MQRLKELRQKKAKTQEDVARYLGIARASYTKYETGTREPDFDTLKKLAKYFNTTTSYIMEETDDPKIPDVIIPEEFKGVKFAFHRGDLEDLTQEEVDKIAEYLRFVKSQRESDASK